MRFYTAQHRHYCGIDVHVRTTYVCILDATGQVLPHPRSLDPTRAQPSNHSLLAGRLDKDPRRFRRELVRPAGA